MLKIDFYILDSPRPEARLEFSVKLTEQLYRKQLRVHLNANDAAQLGHLDERLWTARDISFIPHEISSERRINCPITLSVGELACDVDILVNLGDAVPPALARAQRVVEIINRQDSQVRAGRERYRYYKDNHYPITNHEIGSWN